MSNIPSIAMIPSAYKSGKVYSVLPSDGSGDLNFARASEATRVNKNGLIETVGSNVPRIDYKDGGCPSLLLEPTSTNLLTYSEDFSDASWAKSNATITSNSAISPKGDLTADLITDDAVNDLHVVVQFTKWSSATLKTASIFAKKNTADYLYIANSSTGQYAFFNLSLGTLGTIDGLMLDAKIEDCGNGWYRCSVSNQQNGSLAFGLALLDNTETYVGSGESIYIWGAQLEEKSYATSYIPTNGGTVTREAETASKSGLSSYINSSEGVLYAEIKGFISQDTIDPNRYITITNGTSNERVSLLLGGNPNQLRAIIFSSTQSVNIAFTTSSTDVKQYNKLAVKYKSGDYAFFLNGVKIGGSTETSIFSGNTLNDFSFDVGDGTQQFRGIVKDARVYNKALTDAELAALTS